MSVDGGVAAIGFSTRTNIVFFAFMRTSVMVHEIVIVLMVEV